MEQLVELDTTGWLKSDFRDHLNVATYAEAKRIIVAWLAQQPNDNMNRLRQRFHAFKISESEVYKFRIEEPLHSYLKAIL